MTSIGQRGVARRIKDELVRRFQALIENSTDGIVLFDKDGRPVYASPSISRILGYTVQEFLVADPFALVHPDERQAVGERFERVAQQPGAVDSDCFRVRHANGTWCWIECVRSNLLLDASVRAIVANYRDVTRSREAEESLRRAHDELECRVAERTASLNAANEALRLEIEDRKRVEHTLQTLSRAIEQTGDSVFVTDRAGVIEYVNPSFEVLTGFSPEEVIGKTPRLFSSGLHDRSFYESLWNTLLAGDVFRAVFMNQTKTGQVYHEDQTISPIRDAQGNITHFVSTGRDVTRRDRAEAALRRLNNQLEHEATRIAGVLHDEAGQLLTSAHITLAAVARELPPPARERLHDIRRNLNQVEEQFRQLSHELRPRILDDLGLVEALKFLGEGVARRTGMSVTVEATVEQRCEELVETTIYRLVQEALTNVTKHADASSATVTVRSGPLETCCSVRDDGVGFDVASVFGRRGESSLGLVGIQDRLEALGGTLAIRSTPGAGTELIATIPVEVRLGAASPVGR